MTATVSFWRRAVAIAVTGGVLASCTTGNKIEPPAARPEATRGGRIVVGISEPISIEPSNAADPSGTLVVRTMCDPLVQIDPLSGELVGAIAESWQVTDGGKRITVKLRKGVRFHDGSELTSEDVAFSLSRVASEEAASPLAPLLRPVEGYAQVHGDEEVDEQRLRETLRGLRIIEKYSFEINLTEAHADMVALLGHPLASPVPKKVVERDPDAFAARPVCAGPYQLAAPWRPGQAAISLRRFAGYRAVNEGYTAAGRGYADEIEFRIASDEETEVVQFEAGQLDVAHVPRVGLPQARQRGSDLVVAPAPVVNYLGFPTRVAPFDQPRVRAALSMALDRRALAAAVEGGAAISARGFLPPTLGGDVRGSGCGAFIPERAQAGRARELLSSASVDLTGTPVKLYFNDEFGHRQVMEGVAAQWRAALGLDVQLVPQSWEAHLARATSVVGFDGPFRMSWAGAYASPDAYLAPLFSSDQIGSDNLSYFSDAGFDRLLHRVARRAGDADDRRLDYEQLEDVVCAQLPAIPLTFGVSAHLVRRQRLASARGVFTDVFSGDVLLRELHVASH